jgi:SH3-like domain-containing protein
LERKAAARFSPAIPTSLRYSVGNPVKSARQSFSCGWLVLLSAAVLTLAGCDRGGRSREIAYVSAPQVALRDQVAAVYNKTGMVKNGDRLEVLERDRRYVRVRTTSGLEGWMEQRYLATQEVFDGFQKLVQQNQNVPVQATATTRNDTNLHLEPGRETEHLFQLNSGSKVSVLRRATADRNALPVPKPAPPPKTSAAKNRASKTTAPAPPPVSPPPVIQPQRTAAPILEDWWLVRDAQGKVGWVLGRMIDLDVPLEIAQYAEGQRLIAFFVLNEVSDSDKKVPQYLVLLSEPKDGMPYDYDQIRVFTWNGRKHRYETAYRERNLNGILPVTASHEDFQKEGTLPTFTLHVKDDGGTVSERKYKMNTPIVRRVLAPGEQKVAAPAMTKKRRRS